MPTATRIEAWEPPAAFLKVCDQARDELTDTHSLVADREKAKKQLAECAAQVDGMRNSHDAYTKAVTFNKH